MKPNGGPAFPVSPARVSGTDCFPVEGMFLRDYFAVHCPVDLLDSAIATAPDDADACEIIAAVSYHYADAMLAERDK